MRRQGASVARGRLWGSHGPPPDRPAEVFGAHHALVRTPSIPTAFARLIAEFLPSLDGQITSDFQKSCPAPFAKIFSFAPDPNQLHIRPVLSHSGAYRDRHERGAGCGGRKGARRATAIAGRDEPRERCAACSMIGAGADGKTVPFWHPLLLSSWRRRHQ